MGKIYLVEDDDNIRKLVCYALSREGFEIEGFAVPDGFWSRYREERPDLILLDIMLPGEDGLSILKKLRAFDNDTAVIMLTAKDSEFDKVTGLDLGADDYLAKPFGMMEMISRVKAVLRRTEKSPPNALKNGGIEMNLSEHTVTVGESPVELTLKEYELLRLFMDNIGRVFSREQLLQSVWGSDFMGETRTVDVHIGTLRTKLGECGGYIETVRGVGYRMRGRI